MSVCKVGLSLIFMYIHILPFLTIYLSLPNCLGDLLFLLRFLLLSFPNNVWRLIVFTPFLIIIKSPKQRLETYCFCSISYYYYYYYYSPFFLEIMVHDLPVVFITVHHYRDDNTLLWTMSQISVRLGFAWHCGNSRTNNRLRYT